MLLHICQLVQQLTLLFGYWTVHYKLLKGNFKYGGKTVFALFLAYVVMWYAVNALWDRNIMIMGFVYVYHFAYPAFTYKSRILNSYIMSFYALLFGSIFPNLITALFTAITSAINDGSAVWFDKRTAGPEFYIAMTISIIISFYISYKMCLGVRDTVMNTNGIYCYITFIFGIFLYHINGVLKEQVFTDYGQSPYGIVMAFDVICMSVCIFSYTFILVKKMKKQRKDILAAEKKLKEDYDDFCRKYQLQQQLREINHEVKNYLASGSSDCAEKLRHICSNALAYIDQVHDEKEKKVVTDL